jgi:hypothetical protein
MRSLRTLAATTCLALALAQIALAEDLRIETKVFAGKEKAPVSQNTTLFHDGFVYDYLSDPQQIAVFDKHRGRFVLLDPSRKLKTEISTDQVLTFCGELRTFAINHSNGFLQFCGKPQFAVEYSEKSSDLLLSSEFMNYKIHALRAKSPEAANQIREFSDWYARLNSMTNTGGPPPFARLAVNEELARRELVAGQVELSIPPQLQLGGKSVNMRSEHEIYWRLLRSDLERISETHTQLVNFKSAPFFEFNPAQQLTGK